MVDLSEEEEAAIVAYGAKVVTKHNVRMGQGLVRFRAKDREKLKKEAEKEATPAEAKEESQEESEAQSQEEQEAAQAEEQQAKEKSTDKQAAASAEGEPQEEVKSAKLEDALGLKGVSIRYKDARVAANYTYKNSYDLEPNAGNKYLILRFVAKNEGGSDAKLDINSKQPRFTATVGAVSANAEQNILMNDLATYVGTIPAGGSEELILLFQFAENNLGDISSVSLVVDVGEKKYKVAT